MRPFGDLEVEVMDRLWDAPHPCTVRDVLLWLNEDRSLAYTTVMTVMDNLHRKGWLRRELDGRAYRYEPVCTREEYSARLMTEALSGSGDSRATLLHFVEQIPPEEAGQLQALLRRTRRSRG